MNNYEDATEEDYAYFNQNLSGDERRALDESNYKLQQILSAPGGQEYARAYNEAYHIGLAPTEAERFAIEAMQRATQNRSSGYGANAISSYKSRMNEVPLEKQKQYEPVKLKAWGQPFTLDVQEKKSTSPWLKIKGGR